MAVFVITGQFPLPALNDCGIQSVFVAEFHNDLFEFFDFDLARDGHSRQGGARQSVFECLLELRIPPFFNLRFQFRFQIGRFLQKTARGEKIFQAGIGHFREFPIVVFVSAFLEKMSQGADKSGRVNLAFFGLPHP